MLKSSLLFGEQNANIVTDPWMKPPSHRRRKEPYYKVQYRDGLTLAWKDLRKEAFDTFEDALAFLQTKIGRDPLRIVAFESGRSEIVHEQH